MIFYDFLIKYSTVLFILFSIIVIFVIIYDLRKYRIVKYNYLYPLIKYKTPYKSKRTRKVIIESKGEKICRNVLEDYFNVKFSKARPVFLVNPLTNNPLELDCYNEDKKIAVEYNGVQHYKFSPYFHKTYKDFVYQVYRDKIKKKLCNEHNIKLITVPYTVSNENIKKYILDNLKNN